MGDTINLLCKIIVSVNLFPYLRKKKEIPNVCALGIKMHRALLKTRLHFAQFCVTIEWRHTQNGNLMHTSCWEDKQTQGAILHLGGGDPVSYAAKGDPMSLFYIWGIRNCLLLFCILGILCQHRLP